MNTSEYFKAGDIIVTDRILYRHYGIYTGKGRAIHYAAGDGDFGHGGISIRECSLERFSRDGKCSKLSGMEVLGNENICEALGRLIGLCDKDNPLGSILSGAGRLLKLPRMAYSPEETARRARSRLGESRYNLVFNNCEHFAFWRKTGAATSSQANYWAKLLALLSLMNKKNPALFSQRRNSLTP